MQEDTNFPTVASNVPPKSNESLMQPPQFELVGHSIVSIYQYLHGNFLNWIG